MESISVVNKNVVYSYNAYATIHIYMQNQRHTKRTSDTVLRKIYFSLYLKGCVWERVGDRTELQHIDLHSIGHNRVSFPSSWAAQPEAWGPTLLAFSTAACHQGVWSPNWSNFLSSPSYIIVQRPLLLVGVTIVLIQPIHGQGYNPDIPRPDAPVIYVGAFPILIARPGRRSIYNKNKRFLNQFSKSYLLLLCPSLLP